MNRSGVIVAGLIASMAGPVIAQTETATWIGVKGSWSHPGRWDLGVVPNNGATEYLVEIDGGSEVFSVVWLDMNATVSRLRVDAGDILHIQDGRSLGVAEPPPNTYSLLNFGQIFLDSTGADTTLRFLPAAHIGSNNQAIFGNGEIILGTGGTNRIVNEGGWWLLHSGIEIGGHTIRGQGEIVGRFQHGGESSLIADQAGPLVLTPGPSTFDFGFRIMPTGTLHATGTGGFIFNAGRYLNGGAIELGAGGIQMNGDVFVSMGGGTLAEGAVRFTGDSSITDTSPSGTPANERPRIYSLGIVEKIGGSGVSVVEAAFENAQAPQSSSIFGVVSARSGTLSFTGEFVNHGSLHTAAGATVHIAQPTVNIPQGHSLSGGGTFDIGHITVAGTVSPGDSFGILTTTGDLTLASSSHTQFGIGGTVAGTSYDRLSVGGDFTPGGDVTITFENGFVPIGGQAFTLWQVAGSILGQITLEDVTFVNASNPDSLRLVQTDHAITLGIARTILSQQSGSFNVGSTWVGGQVPGALDTAKVRHTVTIPTGGALGVEGLIVETGALLTAGSGQNVILNMPDDKMQWTGGRLDTGGVGAMFTNTGVMNIIDGPDNNLELRVTLVNQGTVNHSRANNPVIALASGVVNNQGLWDIKGDGGFTISGGGVAAREFNNQATGTLRKSAGTGTSTIDYIFNNQGATVDVQAGTLALARGGNSTGGTFNVSPGATLDLTGGTGFEHRYTGAYTGGGGGTVLFSGGTITAPTGEDVTLNFPGNTFHWASGWLNHGGAGASFTNIDTINVVDGAADARLRVPLINKGTVNHTRAEALPLRFVGGGVVNNQGLWDLQGDGGFVHFPDGGSATREFNNLVGGTLRKSAGTGASLIDVAFNNQGGVIDVQAGTMILGRGGVSTGGSYLVAPGARLELLTSGQIQTYSGTHSGSGGGVIALTGGTIIPAAAGQNANFNFAGSMFQWSGGSIDLFGRAGATFTNLGTMTLIDGTDDLRLRAKLINHGTMNQTRSNFPVRLSSDGIIDNHGIWDIQGNGGFLHSDGGVAARGFNNLATGILRKSAGSGTSTVNAIINNQGGLIEVQSGMLEFVWAGNFNNSGSLFARQGATLRAVQAVPVPAGQILGGGGIFEIPNLTVTGTIAPGDSTGTLTVQGNLLFGSGAIYDWEISGVASDLVAVTGNLTFGATATLNVLHIPPGLPEIGNHVLFTYGGATPILPLWTINVPPDWQHLGVHVDPLAKTVYLGLAAVPEPSALALLGAGMIGLLRRRRRAAIATA